MGKRILFSLNFIGLFFYVASAQSEGSAVAKPFPTKTAVVTKNETTDQTTPSVKTTKTVKPPVLAGKGLNQTKQGTQTEPTAKKTAAKPAKTAVKSTKTKEKPKKNVKKTTKPPAKTKTAATAPAKVATSASVLPKTPVNQPVTNGVKTDSKGVNAAASTTTELPIPISFGKEMLMAVNALRKSGTICGSEKMPPVKPLTWSAQLENAALVHVEDMNTHDHFSHAGTNGSLPDDRIKAAGYEWSRVGENIGAGYKDVSAAIKGWKASSNHCKQMMSKDVVNMGAAKKGNYWCQTFAAPLDK